MSPNDSRCLSQVLPSRRVMDSFVNAIQERVFGVACCSNISIIYHLMHMHILHMLEVSPASCSRHASLIVPHGQLVGLADLHEQTTHNSEQVRRLLSSQCRFSPTVMSRRAREGQTIGLQKKRNTSQWGRCGRHGHHELKQSGENSSH
jgi:hypothetical protein